MAKIDDQIERAIRRIENATERGVLRNYKRALDEVRRQLSLVYERYAEAGQLTNAQMSKYNRLKNLHSHIIAETRPLFSENGRNIERMAAVTYEETFYRYGWAISSDVGVDLRWGLLSDDVVKAAVENPISGLSLHNITLEQRRRTLMGINRAVTQGIVQGDSYPKMARRVKGFLDGDARRAVTVVRTEGQRAYAAGQIASYDRADELGIDVRRIWDATLDQRTRAAHGDLDGTAAGRDGLFDTEVGRIPGPLHSGVGWFDINCRCRVRPEVVGYSPKVRRIRDQGIVKYQTYKEWAKAHNVRAKR